MVDGGHFFFLGGGGAVLHGGSSVTLLFEHLPSRVSETEHSEIFSRVREN